MRFFCYVVGLVIGLTSCSHRTTIEMPALVRSEDTIACEEVFPQGQWQFVHSIAFSMADGKKGTVLGVSVVNGSVIKSALMTIEGFTLFEAEYDGQLKILRAVPPFDNGGFGQGLMRDLQLIFFEPQTNTVHYGKNADGSQLCRYQEKSGYTTDVILSQDRSWEVRQYGSDRLLTRTVKANPSITSGHENRWFPPQQLALHAYDTVEYTLIMDLVSSEKP